MHVVIFGHPAIVNYIYQNNMNAFYFSLMNYREHLNILFGILIAYIFFFISAFIIDISYPDLFFVPSNKTLSIYANMSLLNICPNLVRSLSTIC